MANRPAFRRRLREIREEIAKRPASRFVPDRDVTLSMLAAMIAQAIDRDDREIANVVIDHFVGMIRNVRSR